MELNERKHTVPAATENPSRAAILAAFESVNDIVPVANTTERATVAAAVAPTASRPLFVYRADAAPGRKTEVTENGTTWATVPSGTMPRGIELYSTISTAVGSGVVSGLGFPPGSATYDSDGYFTGPDSLNILTIPAGLGGLYLVSHRTRLSSVVSGRHFADANAVAGGNKVSRANGSGDDMAQSSRTMRLAAGDVFNLNVYHTAGSTLNVTFRSLSLHLIGA